ncbi:hypothetical protein JCM3765_003870 [Sporobolomyces pararoseus]
MPEYSQRRATAEDTARVTKVSESLPTTTYQTELHLNFEEIPIDREIPLETSRCPYSKLSVSILRESEDSFRIIWNSIDPTSVEIRRRRSAAELYWIDPVTEEGFWVASAIGSHKDCWPTSDLPALSLSFSSFDLEAVNHEDADWMKKQNYFARLYFFSDRLPLLGSAPAPEVLKAQELVSPRSITSYISVSTPNNLRFVFSKPAGKKLSLWSSSSVLVQNSIYFERLLHSDFAESKLLSDSDRQKQQNQEVPRTDSQMTGGSDDNSFNDGDADSDYDLDEVFESPESTSSPDPILPYHLIEITDVSFTTYRAVLVWIQTGYISFSPLTSSFSHLPPESRKDARIDSILSRHTLDPLLPLSASLKSVYKLAHFLSLPALQELALNELSRQLTTDNVLLELLSGITSVYDEIRKLEVDFAVENKKEVKRSKGFKDTMEKLRSNELSISGPVAADLLLFFAE